MWSSSSLLSNTPPNEDDVPQGTERVPLKDVHFDRDRLLGCTVENGNTLVHSGARRGYGLAGIGIKSGLYEWKVKIFILFYVLQIMF